jgi:hypothetical protein
MRFLGAHLHQSAYSEKIHTLSSEAHCFVFALLHTAMSGLFIFSRTHLKMEDVLNYKPQKPLRWRGTARMNLIFILFYLRNLNCVIFYNWLVIQNIKVLHANF